MRSCVSRVNLRFRAHCSHFPCHGEMFKASPVITLLVPVTTLGRSLSAWNLVASSSPGWTALYFMCSIYILWTLFSASDKYQRLRRARLIIEIRVDEILAEQGRTFYWLAKQTGISHTTLWRLKKGKAFGMNLDTLEKMCRVLECQPGDILTLANQKNGGQNRKARKKTKP